MPITPIDLVQPGAAGEQAVDACESAIVSEERRPVGVELSDVRGASRKGDPQLFHGGCGLLPELRG